MGHLKSGLQILQNWQESKRIKAADPFRRDEYFINDPWKSRWGFHLQLFYLIEEARNATCSLEIFLDIDMAFKWKIEKEAALRGYLDSRKRNFASTC